MDHQDRLLDALYELWMGDDKSSLEADGLRYDPDASQQSIPGVASDEYSVIPNHILIRR